MPRDNLLWGLYAGYDRYRSDTNRYYNQLNAGGELWFNRVFIGGNVYIPVGTTVYDDDNLNLAYLVPTGLGYRYNIAYAAGKERAMPGIDAEIGYDVTSSFAIYGGGYYFNHADAQSITGPKLRATYTFYQSDTHRLLKIFDRIPLEGLVSYDSIRGTSWMMGLRFTFGFFKPPNPTFGLVRHMADPIRRDLNVVSEGFNNPSEFYMLHGHRAKIDLSKSSERMVEAAVNGNADIIGLVGSQVAHETLMIGARDLVITGGIYSFSHNGRLYTVNDVGINGQLIADDSEELFSLSDIMGNHNIIIENLTIKDSGSHNTFALQTDGGSVGKLIINNVISDMPFDFRLLNIDAVGKFTFTHNVITLKDATAYDNNFSSTFARVLFYSNNASASMDILGFSNNKIYITDRDIMDDNIYGVFTSALSIGSVTFTDNFSNNVIILKHLESYESVVSLFNENTKFDKNINKNTFTSSHNKSARVFGWEFDKIVVNKDVGHNIFNTNHDRNEGMCIWGKGDLTLYGSIKNNAFTSNHNVDGGYGIFLDDGKVNIHGGITLNTFALNHNGNFDNGGILINTGIEIVIDGNINNNRIQINGQIPVGMDIRPDKATFNGLIQGNEIIIDNEVVNDSYGFRISPLEEIVFNQAIKNNLIKINNDSSGKDGFELDGFWGTITFKGNRSKIELGLSNNNAYVDDNGGDGIIYNG